MKQKSLHQQMTDYRKQKRTRDFKKLRDRYDSIAGAKQNDRHMRQFYEWRTKIPMICPYDAKQFEFQMTDKPRFEKFLNHRISKCNQCKQDCCRCSFEYIPYDSKSDKQTNICDTCRYGSKLAQLPKLHECVFCCKMIAEKWWKQDQVLSCRFCLCHVCDQCNSKRGAYCTSGKFCRRCEGFHEQAYDREQEEKRIEIRTRQWKKQILSNLKEPYDPVELLLDLYSWWIPKNESLLGIALYNEGWKNEARELLETNKGYIDYWKGMAVKTNLIQIADGIDLSLYLANNGRPLNYVLNHFQTRYCNIVK